ncbi:MAG: hypothetical protein KDD61_17265, partial [Bdellovibrionales bacterium]|nr:hypothetical protein [Bdellovibrionales bacterium]
PAFGEPIYSTPSPLFVRWYGNCVQRLIQEEFGKIKERGYSKKHLQNYFSHSFLQGLRVEQWELQKWYSWTKTKQLQAITEIVTHLIGPWPVLRDLGWKQEESDYIEKLLESMSTESSSSAWKALQSALLKVMMREEFILY